MSQGFTMEIPLAWRHIRELRAELVAAMTSFDHALCEAACMVASELVENAVKYGEDVPGIPCVRFAFRISPELVWIQVANGTANAQAVEKLACRLDHLAASPDKEALYMDRLQELLADSTQSGQLGLYRIAFEGRFSLAHSYDDNLLTITATRGIHADGR